VPRSALGRTAAVSFRRMRTGVLVAVAAALALPSAPASASPSADAARLRHCAPVRASFLSGSAISANHRCRRARATLRGWLRLGFNGIPPSVSARGAWTCRPAGTERWSCRRHRRGRTERIKFRAAVSPTTARHCVDLWNADLITARYLGLHLYADHKSRRAWAFVFRDAEGRRRCAAVFVVAANDPEFGADGGATEPRGSWLIMNQVPELGDPVATQSQAQANANASLGSDGKLALLRSAARE
jgi:hypothetical protein